MTAEQFLWFFKGWIAGRGAAAAEPPALSEWQGIVQAALSAGGPARGGCGCGGARHG